MLSSCLIVEDLVGNFAGESWDRPLCLLETSFARMLMKSNKLEQPLRVCWPIISMYSCSAPLSAEKSYRISANGTRGTRTRIYENQVNFSPKFNWHTQRIPKPLSLRLRKLVLKQYSEPWASGLLAIHLNVFSSLTGFAVVEIRPIDRDWILDFCQHNPTRVNPGLSSLTNVCGRSARKKFQPVG